MAFKLFDRVQESTTSTGTGDLSLGGAVTGFSTFSSRYSTGDTLYYAAHAVDAAGTPTGEWEVGLGTYSAASTLTRTTVMASSNSDALVNFSAGTKRVFVTMTALQGASVREKLTAARTYYVRTDGSDSNNGLANTSGGAFLTIQKAVNTTCALDMSTNQVTIQVADGTYSAGAELGRYVGSSAPLILGNATTPANVVISASTLGFSCQSGVLWRVESLKVSASSAHCVLARNNGSSISAVAIDFGTTGTSVAHYAADTGGTIDADGDYTISGGASHHVLVGIGGVFRSWLSNTITLSGTPSFSSSFVQSKDCGVIRFSGKTFSGSATGTKYDAQMNGVIQTNGGGASYFPGNVSGGTATGGQYA